MGTRTFEHFQIVRFSNFQTHLNTTRVGKFLIYLKSISAINKGPKVPHLVEVWKFRKNAKHNIGDDFQALISNFEKF